MSQIQTIKNSTYLLRNSLPNVKKINPETLKYIPAKKTKKTASQFETFLFRQYMLALKNNTKVTKDEIKELFSFDGDDFEAKAYEFLIKKLCIPVNIMPACIHVSAIAGDSVAAYSWPQNCIYIKQQNKVIDKASYLSNLRHELQHFLQNMQVLRSEKIGEEVIEYYAELLTKIEVEQCDNMVKNLPLEQIRQSVSEEYMVIYRDLKALLDEGKTKEYEQRLEEVRRSTYNQIVAQWVEIRKNAITGMGIVKEGTKEWKRAEKFFGDIHSSYYTQDNKIDYGKYFYQCIENDAILAGDMMLLNAKEEKFCYPQMLKKCKEQFLSSEDAQAIEIKKSIDKASEELSAKKVSFKDVISYLFD